MSLVLNSSVTIAWVYSEEASEPLDRVKLLVAEEGAWVHSLWKLEVANILQMGVRRKRNDAIFLVATLEDLSLLPIRLDGETELQAWGRTLELADRHGLTVYDAAYLELALRRGLPLASLDKELRSAAVAESVPLLGLSSD